MFRDIDIVNLLQKIQESVVDETRKVVKYKGKEYAPYTLYFPEKKREILSDLRADGVRAVADPRNPDGVLVPVGDLKKAKEYFGESKVDEAEGSVPPSQTMKAQEKPDIAAEDFHMEDYSGEDLEKVKSKSAETGNAIRKVEDNELKVKPSESKGKTRRKKSLWLCTECCKTFESEKKFCKVCKTDEHVEKIIEADASGLVGFTKHVYQVDYKTKDGQEKSTRVMAFDEDDAEDMMLRKADVKEVLKIELIKEGKDRPGKRDGTGPYKHSYQRRKYGKGRRRMAGKKCPVKKESKVVESVEELVGEVPGISIEDQKILHWALEKGVISSDWPRHEKIISALAEVGQEVPEEELWSDWDNKSLYLKYVLLPKAKKAAADAGMKLESKENEEINLGEKNKDVPRLTVVEIHRSTVDPDAYNILVVELPEGNSVTLSTAGDRKSVEKKAKEISTVLGAKYAGFVSESTGKSKGVSEAEESYKTVARGLEDKADAEEIAREKKGQVVADEKDPKKFMVIVKEQ